MPGKDTIDMLAGTIDFYAYLGIPCARKWPVRHIPLSANEKAQWTAFRYINQIAIELPPIVQTQWKRMVKGTDLTWKDMLNRAYIGHTFNPEGYPRTLPQVEITDRFLINNWTMTQDKWEWHFIFYTDVPCRLFLQRLNSLPLFKVVTRLRRGYDEYKDAYYEYLSESSESPYPYEETTEHHWNLLKAITIYQNGFFFWARHNDRIMSSISQYFSPTDLRL